MATSDEARRAFDAVFGQYYAAAYPTDQVWLNKYIETRLVPRRFVLNDVDRLVLGWLASRSTDGWYADRLENPASAMQCISRRWVELTPNIFEQKRDWMHDDVVVVAGVLDWAVSFMCDQCWWPSRDGGDFHDPLNHPGLLAAMGMNPEKLAQLASGLEPLVVHLYPRFVRQGQLSLAIYLAMRANLPPERCDELFVTATR